MHDHGNPQARPLQGCDIVFISASRRTDIPAFYGPWFQARLKAGYVLTRNPYNPRQISRVPLDPDVVDGFVFWTKNPEPFLPILADLEKEQRPFYVQYTVNTYEAPLEGNVPKLRQRLHTFERLRRLAGPDAVVWRYDPVIFTDMHTARWHLDQFKKLASVLAAWTDQVTVSYLSRYKKTLRNMEEIDVQRPSQAERRSFLAELSEAASACNLRLTVCCPQEELNGTGAVPAQCIDPARLERRSGQSLRAERDKNQRPGCGCAQSIDIGSYDTCRHQCLYCYANTNHRAAARRAERYDPAAPILGSPVGPQDQIKPRSARSFRTGAKLPLPW